MQRGSNEGAAHFTMQQLADELAIEPCSVRKYVRRMSIVPHLVPHSHFRGRMMQAITCQERERLLEHRRANGIPIEGDGPTRGWKWFYAILVHPDRDPAGEYRVKLGIGKDSLERLKQHQIVAPTARIQWRWSCRKKWEKLAIESISREGVLKKHSRELFDFDDIEAIKVRGDAFFACMPRPPLEQPTSPMSRTPSERATSVNPETGKGGVTDSSQELMTVMLVRPVA